MEVSLFGTVLLCVAAFAALIASGAGFAPIPARRGVAVAGAASTALFVSIAAAFILLAQAYLETDLSLLNVFLNSHSLKPPIYKFTGVWGNHEGSLLLWLLILGGVAAAMGMTSRGDTRTRQLALGVQGLLVFAFLMFTILTSSPFTPYPEAWPPAPDGQGLNPLLQDPGLAIHPPTLYVGYVGLSAVYSFTIAALIRGELGREWAMMVRPFLLVAWSALTLGIGLGAYWAYYELGWGGFWFWDPVENASLMPWLASTALLHCVLVVERRNALKSWCAALAILAFGASLLGAFLVRSGIVTSVHAFANDPERGIVLLLLSVLFTGGGFALFAVRGAKLVTKDAFEPVSREGALVLNNLLFSVLLFTVFLGTFWPTVVEVTSGTRISVGPPYYNMMNAPLVLLMAATLAFGLLIPWKREGRGLWRRPYVIIIGGGLAIAALLAFVLGGSLFAFIGFAASLLVLGGVGADLWRKAGSDRRLARLANLPARSWGAVSAHIGLALLILGATASTVFSTETRGVLAEGESITLNDMTLTFEDRFTRTGPNYLTEINRFVVTENGRERMVLQPSQRYYPVADQATAEVAIKRKGLGNLYLAAAPAQGGTRERVVRAYEHPLIHLMWGGAVMVAVGGLIAAFARQKRLVPAPGKPAQAEARA